jgi:BON domain
MENKKVSKKNRPDAASATAKQFSSTVVNRRAVEWTGWTFLKDKAFDLTSVNVKTTDGSVDLSGTVPSLDARERAVKLAWQVRGLWRRAAQVHGFLFVARSSRRIPWCRDRQVGKEGQSSLLA